MKPDRDTASASLPDALTAAAAEWVARRDAGLTDAERQQLQAWLAEDAAHRAALAQADTQSTEVDWALHAGAVDEVLAGLEQGATRRRKRRRVLAGASAAVVLLVAGLTWRNAESSRVALGEPAVASVKILEPRRLALPDGSMAELREGAEIAIDFSGPLRRVTLRRGAAHFQVAHDTARTFVVSSSGLEVRAVGTAFSVQLETKDVEVVVTEGRVAVGRTVAPASASPAATAVPAPAPVFLDAGHGLVAEVASATIAAPQFRALPETVLSERLAWRVPRIEFAGTPLTEVVAVMNRHNRIQFVLADADLGRLQLSGIVGADKVEALREMLETGFAIRAERNGDRIILRRAR